MGSEAGALEDVRVIFRSFCFSRRRGDARVARRVARVSTIASARSVRIDSRVGSCAVEVGLRKASLFVHTVYFWISGRSLFQLKID